MTTASHPPTLADLWREARAWLAGALHEFSGPAQIAATLAAAARAAIRARLALIEALVMKLLLIEAAAHPDWSAGLQARKATPVSTCAPEGARSNLAPTENPRDPKTWRVRFHLRIPRDRQRITPTRPAPLQLQPRPEHIRAHAHAHARALARRFEALRRVIADPRRAIAALARKLTGLGFAARAAARRIALARGPRSENPGFVFATAMVLGQDASFSFPGDTS
jgi:hypothetical protein